MSIARTGRGKPWRERLPRFVGSPMIGEGGQFLCAVIRDAEGRQRMVKWHLATILPHVEPPAHKEGEP